MSPYETKMCSSLAEQNFLSSFILSLCFLIVFFLYSLFLDSQSHRAGGLVSLHSVSFHRHRGGVILFDLHAIFIKLKL